MSEALVSNKGSRSIGRMVRMSNVEMLNKLAGWQALLIANNIDPEHLLLWVDVEKQSLFISQAGKVLEQYTISTALKGTGCQQDSFQTPTGLHIISEKIGDKEQLGKIFRGRQAVDELATIEASSIDTGKDHITSRILWLSGLQEGINKGLGVDTRERYIYIHGTNEEGRIGQAVSHGCIRMKNTDVIALYDQVKTGMAVIIE